MRSGRGRPKFLPMTVDESPRIAAARALNLERERRRMRILRPMALIVFVSVLLPALGERPRPALHGAGLPVTLTLVVTLVAVLAVAVPDPPVPEPGAAVYSRSRLVVLLCVLGLSANVLNALQGDTVGLLSSNLVVWLAAGMLDLAAAVPVALFAAVPAVVEVAVISSTPLLASVIAALFFGLIFFIGHNGRRMRKELARNELLVAELADMSEAVAGSAALAERGRIAREMHDVLAHSLSGLALQLEGAGLMAKQEGASDRLQAALRRARRLAHEGLDEARRAIEALRGARVPGPDALPRLIEEFGQDAKVSVTLSIDGEARPLSAEAALTVYRVTQEALTNIARHSAARTAEVLLRYDRNATRLVISDHRGPDGFSSRAEGSDSPGAGYGLTAMRERAALLDGTVTASQTDDGFRVELMLPRSG